MKRVMVLMALFLSMLQASTAYAIQEHYNGNPNYPMIFNHQGVVVYVDKTSIAQQIYAPPFYRLAIAVFRSINGGTGPVENYHAVTFDYDYAHTEMNFNDKGSREWLDPLFESERPNYGLMVMGEAAFYIEYGIKFYGRYMWKSKNTGEYRTEFDNDFYDILDNKQ